jgi:hypothetical protein
MSLTFITLKTKFNSYASFHMSVNEKDFPPINNTGVRNRLYGRLNPNQIYSSAELTPARTTLTAAVSSNNEANEGDQSASAV